MKYLLATAMALTASQSLACGGADDPCETPLGTYHIALPEGVETPPAVLFLHGAGGSGKSTIRMQNLLDRGYAAIGPNGLKRPGSSFGSSWSFHPDRTEIRDELAFMREVIADAVSNHGVDADNILLAGFSIGGSMTSYLACEAPDLARAYAPVAGSFWRPHPALDACEGPVQLLHTHGWRDMTVPLEGRPLNVPGIEQGDVFYGMQMWRAANGCDAMRADTFDMDGPFWRRKWTTCADGALEFALHQGAHGIPQGWSDMALDWFEGLAE